MTVPSRADHSASGARWRLRGRAAPAGVVLIHHRLAGYSSHHFNEAQGFIRELARRGTPLRLLINAQAPPAIAAALGARAVLDDPTFRMEWSFAERSRRFVELLRAHVEPELRAGDCVLLTVATQLEAHALAHWLQLLPRAKKPWIALLFLSDRWNRGDRTEYERQALELREVRCALAALQPADACRISLFAVTQPLAQELSHHLGAQVMPAPVPLPYGRPPARSADEAALQRPRVAVFGGTRREKGSHLLPAIVRACRARADVKFLVQLANNTLTAAEVESVARIAAEPGVQVLRDALPPEEYEAALASTDLALFPYEVTPYRKRCSGVFAEAVAYGKPVVVTAGTWLAAQIEQGHAAGVSFDTLQPECVARAVARCVADLDALRRAAQALSEPWRERVSLPAFVDLLEAQLARRRREQPARWWRWPR